MPSFGTIFRKGHPVICCQDEGQVIFLTELIEWGKFGIKAFDAVYIPIVIPVMPLASTAPALTVSRYFCPGLFVAIYFTTAHAVSMPHLLYPLYLSRVSFDVTYSGALSAALLRTFKSPSGISGASGE